VSPRRRTSSDALERVVLKVCSGISRRKLHARSRRSARGGAKLTEKGVTDQNDSAGRHAGRRPTGLRRRTDERASLKRQRRENQYFEGRRRRRWSL